MGPGVARHLRWLASRGRAGTMAPRDAHRDRRRRLRAATRPRWSRPSSVPRSCWSTATASAASAVLTDCVPSKTLIATAEVMTIAAESPRARRDPRRRERPGRCGGRRPGQGQRPGQGARAGPVGRHRAAPRAGGRARRQGAGRLDGPQPGGGRAADGGTETLEADVVLVATGAHPRVLPGPSPTASGSSPGASSTTCTSCPSDLVVVGSGVTGAEFASAYHALGCRGHAGLLAATACCPARTPTPPRCWRRSSPRRGMTVLGQSRAAVGEARRRRRRGHARRRPDRRGQPLPDGGRLGAQHRRARAGGGRRRAWTRAGSSRRPGLPDHAPRRLRRRRLHRRAHARLGRGDAGPDRDVARARRGSVARCDLQTVVGERVHRPGDRHRRRGRRQRSRPARSTARTSRCRWRRTPAPRCRASRTAS